MNIQIQQSVPVPTTGWKGAPLPNYPKSNEYPWSEMSEGDSFFVPVPEGGDVVRLMNRITGSARNKLGPKAASARCVMENGLIGVRVWRIKP